MAGSVDNGLTPLFTVQYTTALELLLQQKTSMLRGHVREGFHTGKMASPVQQISSITMKAPAGRFQPKQNTQAQYARRWVFPQAGEIDYLIDSFDELQTIVDPKSAIVQASAAATARYWDDNIIAASTGTAQVGTDPASLTSETFSTTNFQIATAFGGGSTTGLTVAKLIEARRILRHYHNDLETDPLCCVAGSTQESELLKLTQVTSAEYNGDRPVLVDGKVTRFVGFDMVFSERLPSAVGGTASTRGVFAFVKSGLYLGMWKEMTNRISIRNELESEPWDLYTSTMFGATRMEEGKVIQILCYDTAGVDVTP
jgi:Phage capsid protein